MIGGNRCSKFVMGCFAALCWALLALPGGAEESLRDDARSVLTVADLKAAQNADETPVQNAEFMPVGEHAPAHHSFEGTLSLPEFELHAVLAATAQKAPNLLPGQALFPGVDLQFFVYDGYLVPVRRDVVRPRGGASWSQIIVAPGRVWSEPSDNGFSRASFPFIVVNDYSNDSHNGVATFVFDDTNVSSLRLQITQEAAPWAIYDMWGQTPMTYRPHAIQERSVLAAKFSEELSREVPMRAWSELEAIAGAGSVSAIIHQQGSSEGVSAAGLIVDGVIYAHPCRARYGDYPYCGQMRHGVYSVTKSMGAALTLLRLAEKYGPEVFDLKIVDYLDISARHVSHGGWRDVTFAHVLSMATGIGYRSRVREPLKFEANEDNPTLLKWLQLLSAEEKLSMALSVGGDYPWGPGEVARYDTMHSFILSAAMSAFLKSREGREADLWDMVQKEVLEPIGAYHVPIMRTLESVGGRGLPIMGFGLYLRIDDVAKIAQLLHDGGKYGGRQLLHPGKLSEALYQTEKRGLPTGGIGQDHEYQLSFWMKPFNDNHGCETWLPKMMGYGGHIVMILPNRTTAFRFADNHHYQARDLALAAHSVRPLCPR
ncbi:MAG: serine hydrolase [Proteobacteria bacterium]|nr:serine hydrolase [Pseudomonadota bacterium]MDA1357180.1 serine hydrolase [Pseudomonadota bacterium]